MDKEKKNILLPLIILAFVILSLMFVPILIEYGSITIWLEYDGWVLTYIDSEPPQTLDPINCWDPHSARVIDQCTETLFTYDYSDNGTHMNLKPLLATSYIYEDSGDHPIYTFTLRQRVRFHDGQPWNAAACKWNMDRWDYWWNLTGDLPSYEHLGTPAYLYHFADGNLFLTRQELPVHMRLKFR